MLAVTPTTNQRGDASSVRPQDQDRRLVDTRATEGNRERLSDADRVRRGARDVLRPRPRSGRHPLRTLLAKPTLAAVIVLLIHVDSLINVPNTALSDSQRKLCVAVLLASVPGFYAKTLGFRATHSVLCKHPAFVPADSCS